MTRPNIVFLFSDQQRWDTLGCYGQGLPISPHLDQMAAEGVRFEHTYTCQPVCGPARACLQTGLYATQLGVFRNNIALPLNQETVAKQLSAHGYSVGYIGKWHLASTGGAADIPLEDPANFRQDAIPPERRGGYRDYWLASDALEVTSHSYDGHMFDGRGQRVEFPTGRYRADVVTDFVLDFLRGPKAKSPFFLFVSYIEPHHQNDHNRYEGPLGSKERFNDYAVPGDLVGTQGDWEKNFPDYLGCCHSLDENVGRIRACLAEVGLAESTVVFYTSDHGSHFRTRNAEYKRSCHDGCIRVPLIIAGGPFRGGSAVSGLVSLLDLPATILDLAGVPLPPYFQGRSLVPWTRGPVDPWRDAIFLQISESQVGRAIRTKEWKYSVKGPGKDGSTFSKSSVYVEEFLYNLEKDPHERVNLIELLEYAQIRADLQARLVQEMVWAGEQKPKILPAARAPCNGLYLSNQLGITPEGEAFMTIHFEKGAQPLEIPLGELLEEVLNIPLVVDLEGQILRGSLRYTNEQLFLDSPEGLAQRFAPSLHKWKGQVVTFMTLNPTPEELMPGKSFKPRWTLALVQE